jgi:hypothetical protein
MGVNVDQARPYQAAIEIEAGKVAVQLKVPAGTTEAMRPSSIVRSINVSPSRSAASPTPVTSVCGARAFVMR